MIDPNSILLSHSRIRRPQTKPENLVRIFGVQGNLVAMTVKGYGMWWVGVFLGPARALQLRRPAECAAWCIEIRLLGCSYSACAGCLACTQPPPPPPDLRRPDALLRTVHLDGQCDLVMQTSVKPCVLGRSFGCNHASATMPSPRVPTAACAVAQGLRFVRRGSRQRWSGLDAGRASSRQQP